MKQTYIAVLAAGIVLAGTGFGPASAQDDSPQNQAQQRTQGQARAGNVYGWQLMTPAERDQYRQQMRQMHTRQERERFRAEHHRQMQERARERGITLPEEPGRGRGSGMGPGMGPGNGPHNGMGQGMGSGMGGGRGPGAGQ